MKRRLATIAASAALAVAGATIASTASAGDFFSLSIGGPGFGIGYSNHGYPRAYGYVAPPVVYAPPVRYYSPAVVYPAPYVYGPRIVYTRPYYRYHHRYWRHDWR